MSEKPTIFTDEFKASHFVLIERVTEPGSWRKLTAGGEAEPSIVRRQFPDGSVPETLQECAEGWKRHYDRMLDDWNVMRQQRDNALEAEARAINSIQAMHREKASADPSPVIEGKGQVVLRSGAYVSIADDARDLDDWDLSYKAVGDVLHPENRYIFIGPVPAFPNRPAPRSSRRRSRSKS